MQELKKNDIRTARIDGYTAEGAGVCHIDGRAVFVPGTLRGEEWEIRIVKVTASLAWGRGEKRLVASPARREPDCAAYPRCGGCAARHMSYEEELSMKLLRVNDALERIGGLDLRIPEILPAGDDARQRRKVIFNIGEADGRPAAGFYRARSHDIVPVAECPAVPEGALRCVRAVLDWMEARGIPARDESAGRDGVRHVFYRSSRRTGQAVVVLIVSKAPKAPDLEALTERLRRCCPEMTGLVLNVNPARGNTILAGEFRTIWGEESLTESLCGLDFSLSPRSFFQVNPSQAERLYGRAMDYAGICEGTRALDLYCGTGTIALCMAKRGARVIGAEVIPAAVANARENAARNGLSDRCEFLCADAGEAAEELRRRDARPEVIVVDPPRKGLSPAVIEAAASMAPERIVYVSCDPGTLARDLALFRDRGYAAAAGTAVDMFPRTSHVETVVLLCRKAEQADRHIAVDYEPQGRHMEKRL
ncbi:MAG: 23S rRNA (uracil(1939)-C(5))-methyltransferase RlmD [Oscillospiraceae bacterium]|nr:23S rRNA (uracil(1939)-C(5))-methyltransferase RlmD [Oscillospiraceae bacterium]